MSDIKCEQTKKIVNPSIPEEFAGRRFNSYSAYFKRRFGSRLQKVTINAGFTCPNRDGKIGVGGCTFCNNEAFTPSYCMQGKSVKQQIDEGIEFHINRYRKASKYLAYFQSYSNTYASLNHLQEIYNQALDNPLVEGLIIGTRPDCVDEPMLDYFAHLAQKHYLTIEYGVESTYDETLMAINRGHDFATARRAIEQTAQRGIDCGAHFILGLPGESEEMLLLQIDTINSLPIKTIKFHQLQIFKGTIMANEWEQHPERFHFWEMDEYIDLFITMLERLRPDIVVERFAGEAPPRYHLGPTWGLVRNETLLSHFEKRLEERNTFQGRLFL